MGLGKVIKSFLPTGSKCKVKTLEEPNGVFHSIFADVRWVGDPNKKDDILVAFCVPSLDGQIHYSILHLWTRVSLEVAYVINVLSQDTYVNYSRNKLVDIANEIGAESMNRLPDYYLFLDQDSVVHPEVFTQLKAKDLDIVSADYVRKRRWIPVWTPVNFYGPDGGKGRKYTHKKGDLVEVITTGGGCLLVKGDVMRKLPPPWFKTRSDDKIFFGEDAYFCQHARDHGYKVWVATDVPIGHCGSTIFPADFEQRKRKPRSASLVWEL